MQVKVSKSPMNTTYAAQVRSSISSAAATTIPGFQKSYNSSHHDAIKNAVMKKVRSSSVPSEWADIAEKILHLILDVILANLLSLLTAVLPALFVKRP